MVQCECFIVNTSHVTLLAFTACQLSVVREKRENFVNILPVKKIEIALIVPEIVLTLHCN